ncbi:MAG: coproporphyrinogen dehydrogenase HemZ [Finegoldia sp.]|nr:coproporphyrinogen dehydrogenase HemZ [Finegoldia sp.]
MIIDLRDQRYKKDLIDIFSIFAEKSDLSFGENPDFFIEKDKVVYKSRVYNFSGRLDLKRIVYKIFSKLYNYESDWGLLTGTKPSKLTYIYTRDQIREKYLVKENKLDLLYDIRSNQAKLSIDRKKFNIYINIPFCPSRCDYCSFPTCLYQKNDRRGEYLSYLKKEIQEISKNLDKGKISSIYIGGGTPTSLDETMLDDLLGLIEDSFLEESQIEYTVEAGREDTINDQKLDIMKAHRVSRISLNPQTFNPRALKTMGRSQDNQRLIQIYKKAYGMGFIINMDFILGLLDDEVEDTRKNLEIIKNLQPHNVTFHTLAIKNGSRYSQKLDEVYDRQKAFKQMELVMDFMGKTTYEPYYMYRQKNILANMENIGFSLNGYFCHYNVAINEEKESILGLGMTSNSKILKRDRIEKYRNYKNLDDYMEKIDEEIERKVEILNG